MPSLSWVLTASVRREAVIKRRERVVVLASDPHDGTQFLTEVIAGPSVSCRVR